MCCLFCKKRDCEPSCAQQTCAQPSCPQPACIPQPTCGPQPIVQPLCAQPVNECQVPTYAQAAASTQFTQYPIQTTQQISASTQIPSTQFTQYPIETSQQITANTQIPSTQYIEAQPAGGIQTNNQFNLTYNYPTSGIADNNLASINYGESLSYPNTSPANYNLEPYGFTNQANGGLSGDFINSGNGQSYVPYGPTSQYGPGFSGSLPASGNGQSISYGTYGPSNQPGDMTGTSYGSFGPTSQVDPYNYCQTYNAANNAGGQNYAGNYGGAVNINYNVNMNGANGNNLFSSSTNKQESTTHIKKRSKRLKPKVIVHKMDADDESGEDELIARITVNY